MNTLNNKRVKLKSDRVKELAITTMYLKNQLGKTKNEIADFMNVSHHRIYEMMLNQNKLKVNYVDELT